MNKLKSLLSSKGRILLLLVLGTFFYAPLSAQPSTNINTYVLFAYKELHFKGRNGGDPTRGVIEGGNVGVNSCNIPNTKNLTFGNPVKMPTAGTYAVGYNVSIDDGCDIERLYAHTVQSGFDPSVLRIPPVTDYTCPLIPAGLLPVFPAVTPGATDVTVDNNLTLTLSPGNYKDLRVKDNAVLYLLTGIYNFKSMSCGKKVKVFTTDGTDVRVAEDMLFNTNCYVGPSNLAHFYVRADGVGGNDACVAFSQSIEFHGLVLAPNGRLNLGNHSDLFGRFWAGSISSDFNVSIHGPGRDPGCVCTTCNNTVVTVDQDVNIDFNTTTPTYTGDADLLPYFAFDKSGGATADKWKVFFNMGAAKLLIKSPAKITVSQVNGSTPSIIINSTCSMELERGASILNVANNHNAGDILLYISGNIEINGEIRNEVIGTLGLPGAITAISNCGDINVEGLVQDLGIDPGGNTISLFTCGQSCSENNQGNITINGLVRAYAHAHAGDLTLNRPVIKVGAFNGSVTINANTVEPLFDEFSINGGLYDLWGGLLSWVRDNVNPGKVEVQAKKDIVVNGHGSDPTGPVRTSFGAIAAIATSSDAPGGLVDVRSLDGNITGNDRAFDVSGRNRLATNFAMIRLWSKLNISLNRLGGNNTFNPIVDASAPGAGDKGGKNDIRSYFGGITVGSNAVVTAAGSVPGTNNLGSCSGITNSGTVTPADANAADNTGVCAPVSPPAIFTQSPCLGTRGTNESPVTFSTRKTEFLNVYPNPFSQSATISYSLASDENVIIKVFTIAGKEVRTLQNAKQAAGNYTLQLNGSALPGGVYVLQMQAGEFSGVKKLMLMK